MRRKNLYYIFACILLVLTIIFTGTFENTQRKISLSRPLSELPEAVGGYSGENVYPNEKIAKLNSADNWIVREYNRQDKDDSMLVFVGYWEHQNEKKVIFSPRYITGAQYAFKQKTISNKQNDRFVFNSFVLDNNQQKELVYYCFLMDGKVIPDDYKLRFLRMVNSLFYRKNNAGLLRVSTPITSDFPVEAAEPYIEDFIKDFLPIVREYLPK
jgi:EpsI family protein